MTNVRSALKRAVLSVGVAAAIVVVAPRQAAATTVCSLTTAGSSCTFGSGLFFTDEQHPTGTGYVDSFLRIQQNGYEQGYNTSARPLQSTIDDKVDPNFTRDLALANVGIKNIGGVDYREFFLDVNEAASLTKSYITLDQLEIFGSNSTKLNNYTNLGANNASGALAGATKLYDMDTAGDGAITLNYTLSGSGSGS